MSAWASSDAWQISGMMPCVQKGLSECESVTQLRFFMSTYSTIALAVSSYTPARPNVKQAAATTRKPSNGTTVSTSADDGSSDGCIGFGKDRRALHPADNGGCILVHTLLSGHRHCPRPNGASCRKQTFPGSGGPFCYGIHGPVCLNGTSVISNQSLRTRY